MLIGPPKQDLALLLVPILTLVVILLWTNPSVCDFFVLGCVRVACVRGGGQDLVRATISLFISIFLVFLFLDVSCTKQG